MNKDNIMEILDFLADAEVRLFYGMDKIINERQKETIKQAHEKVYNAMRILSIEAERSES